jgi:glucokinase
MRDSGREPLYGLVDIGGTKVVAGIARGGEILATRRVLSDPAEGADMVMRRMAAGIGDVKAELGLDALPLAGIGASVPGPNDLEHGIVLAAHNVGWFDYPFVERFGTALGGIPVFIDDDANCAGVGEARFGAGVGFPHQVYITVSTGIGGAVIIDGRIYRGWQGVAGEVGHVTVLPEGPTCPCGNVGCAEAVASGPAIARRGAALFVQNQSPILAELAGGDPASVTTRLVFDAARAGDPACLAIVDEAGRFLGILVAGLVQVLNPQAVILGGGVIMAQDDLLLPRIEAEMRRHVFAVHRDRVVLRKARHGDRSGLYGALALVMEAVGDA